MKHVINPGSVSGSVRAPPSKSHTHRALLCGLLAKGTTRISRPSVGEDAQATRRLVEALGAKVKASRNALHVKGAEQVEARTRIVDCGGSGTTLRMGGAVAALSNKPITLDGNASLRRRPVTSLVQALSAAGARAVPDGDTCPVRVGGGLKGGTVKVDARQTSQPLSGLLVACTRAEKKTELVVQEAASRPYIEQTLAMLQSFKAGVEETPTGFRVDPSIHLTGTHVEIPGDFSGAAFLLAAGALAGRVEVQGLPAGSHQADSVLVNIMIGMGAEVHQGQNSVRVEKSELTATAFSMRDSPDLFPVLAVLATQARGVTRLTSTARLKTKECDRVAVTAKFLKDMGASVQVGKDEVRIKGPVKLKGTTVDPHNDHRIAMAASVAALAAKTPTTVQDAQCVEKSFPSFFETLKGIGVDVS